MSARRRAVAVVMCVLPIVGVAGCASDSTLSIVLAESSVHLGEVIAVEGVLSEDSAGVPVTLETSGTSAEYLPADATTTTDSSGRYAIELQVDEAGQFNVRAVASPEGGDPVTSPAVELTVLAPTQVKIASSLLDEVDVAKSISISGVVSPGEPRRDLVLQESSGNGTWMDLAITGATKANGRFRLKFTPEEVGLAKWRVAAIATTSASEGYSRPLRTYVVDLEAAGARYLRCVADYNASLPPLHDVPWGSVELRAAAAVTSEEALQMGRCLQSYAWPPSVQADVDSLIDASATTADVYTRLSQAANPSTSSDIYSELSFDEQAARTASTIRLKLGLPPRPTD